MSAEGWKEALAGSIDDELAKEIDIFETQIELRRQARVEEALFNETRLRRGVYGQRYDNGQRHDGIASQRLDFPSGDVLKGPGTMWDAPGMQRIKIPFGGLSPEQMDVLADLSEEYADEICHVTTRQDIQLHFVHIDDTPTIMRRLATVGITTREACGNSVRNVTACHVAGVCHDESFDVTPYADGLADYLLGHPDAQNFGRKFKVSFSGCKDKACGLTTIHDLGFIARSRELNGELERGFEAYVGGGLGAVPYPAQLYDAFLPARELLPFAQAVCRVFARLGEKRNRARARLKFVIQKVGIEEFRRLVEKERAELRADPRWSEDLGQRERADERGLKPASSLVRRESDGPFGRWRASNVAAQKQSGYSVATVALPLGDISARQLRGLADIARRYTRGTVRTTVEQNIVLRWVSDADLPSLHGELETLGLAAPGAGTIVDVTACPGTDTCKLGIASSRGLAAELSERLATKNLSLDEAVRGLRIKVSGCFNSCGQQQIADIGFYGVSRKVGGYTVAHFQAVIGGQWTENAKSYGLAIGALPSRNIPMVVDRLTAMFVDQRETGESFQTFVRRVGKRKLRDSLEDLFDVPDHALDPSFYSDWGDPREFTLGDLGVGECAGEVVSAAQFGLAASERQVFEAQELLDGGDAGRAAERSYAAMLEAAKALTREIETNLGDDPNDIVQQFRAHFYDTKLFFDPFAGGKFAHYLFRAHESERGTSNDEAARRSIEEAQLFIEAAHGCYGRLVDAAAANG